jgi:hypothetical protein
MATQQLVMVVMVMVLALDRIQFAKQMELGVHLADGIVAM